MMPAPYGYCPTCKSPGKTRERRPDGNDTCENGHVYASRSALTFADIVIEQRSDCDAKKENE